MSDGGATGKVYDFSLLNYKELVLPRTSNSPDLEVLEGAESKFIGSKLSIARDCGDFDMHMSKSHASEIQHDLLPMDSCSVRNCGYSHPGPVIWDAGNPL